MGFVALCKAGPQLAVWMPRLGSRSGSTYLNCLYWAVEYTPEVDIAYEVAGGEGKADNTESSLDQVLAFKRSD